MVNKRLSVILLIITLWIIVCMILLFVNRTKINKNILIDINNNFQSNNNNDVINSEFNGWNFDLFSILEHFKTTENDLLINYSKLTSFDKNNKRYVMNNENNLKKVKSLNDLDVIKNNPQWFTVFNISSKIVIPKTIDENDYTHLKYINDSGIAWLSQFSVGIIMHTPGYIADTTYFNDKYVFTYAQELLRPKCYFNSKLKIIDYPLLNLNGWSADAFQHYLIEIPVRFALVYKWFMNNYNKTNIHFISPKHSNKHSIDYFFWYLFNLTENHFYENNIHKTVGWCVKKDWTYYSPLIIQGYYMSNRPRKNRKIWPRNCLLPIQHILSNSNVNRNMILYLTRGNKGLRSVSNEPKVIETIKNWIKSRNQSWEFEIFNPKLSFEGRLNDRNLVSRSVIIIGPHGGKFANMVFAQRETYIVEFVDVLMTNLDKPFRSGYYSLSQAAGFNYWYLKPENWGGYFAKEMNINTEKLKALLNLLFEDITKNNPKFLRNLN